MTSILPGLSGHETSEDPGGELWGVRPAPGWGLWVDLTPPELVTARKVRRLRRWLAAGLVVMALVVLAGYGWGIMRQRAADADLAAVQQRTAELTRQQDGYGDAVRLGSTTQTYVTTLSKLTDGDVDSTTVLSRIEAALPKGMTVTELRTTVTSVAAANTAGSNTAGSTGSGSGSGTGGSAADPLAAAGQTSVGSVTISGNAPRADGIPAFATALARQPGFSDVVPATTQAGQGGYQYSVTLSLDQQLVEKSVADQLAGTTGGTK